ncbi:exodeoxyribonuclease 7 large subunit [Thiohalobacter sp. COW1]|uniref:Exodeoxyribonuclease 7 large subunit n=1 Tax=Thiohalobacter thiocyanaticus TaxID=585455 RepID=A0A1Z4VR11_9GAMM|nr:MULTISPECIES: exodeoxyribonuclease VII large subunit [Thiohalobacter]BAZ93644.1 exonuclease VII, large subunit [Thiohalobacter thiocyanaticus]BCO31313.1 exodeoxyribonuclease 7 large subunit [Thiohalobacter sp. COW1]
MQRPDLPPPSPALPGDERDVFTVSRLNAEARDLLESRFPLIWVEGELSNLARPGSGHWYFSLKDARAQVGCAMFRGRNRNVRFQPQEGMQVLVRASVSLYEARGNYQLIVEHMEEAGAGALRRAFEQLRDKLDAEGLFAEAHKQPLPALPRRIGVITSPTGAAIRDILSVLGRRFPAIPVLVYPVPVQGEGAGAKIAETIALADARRDCDVLILARGGGSLEDLWAFNEEGVARAIHACRLPVVTGIGHEIDFTIADFVADRRAPTPSVAAEMVSPSQDDWRLRLRDREQKLTRRITQQLERRRERLAWLEQRLQRQHPGQRLTQWSQRLDELEGRLQRSQQVRLRHARSRLSELAARLHRHNPVPRLEAARQRQTGLAHRLHLAMRHQLQRERERLTGLMRQLDTVSPLATLERGYAIVRLGADGRILRSVEGLQTGDIIDVRLARGRLTTEVKTVHGDEDA